jgi:hypothetical protein
MSTPQVTITVLDGQVGVLPPSSSKPLAIYGVSDSGTSYLNLPATFSRKKAAIDALGRGPLVEAMCHALDRYGIPVCGVKSGASNAGAFLDSVDAADGEVENFVSGAGGTSVASVAASPEPTGAHTYQILFVVGATIGVAGAVYQIYRDGDLYIGGAALGTDTDITVDGVQIDFAAGTLTAGRSVTFSTTAPIEASAGEVVDGITGSSAPTIAVSPLPVDDYEMKVLFVTGGTRGVTGIEYKISFDGGRTYGGKQALGTAVYIDTAGGGRLNLGAGTIAANDYVTWPTVAPSPNSEEIADALQALRETKIAFEIVAPSHVVTADSFDVIDSAIQGMAAIGKYVGWIGNVRLPVGDETEAEYLASVSAAFASKETTYGNLCAGACEFASGVNGRKYRRPISFVVAAREAASSEEIHIADTNQGSMPCSIRDADGNPKHHDELLNPGLDDARFTTLRTFEGLAGVYVNRSRCFSSEGSDFFLFTYRRVMNLANGALMTYFIRRLNKAVQVDKATGYITEVEALEIEQGALKILESRLRAKPKCSGVEFSLSRTDNVLSTRTLTGDARIIPLAYPDTINLTSAFKNPALQTV